MICPHCNKQINDDNQFCPICGQRLDTSLENDSVNSYWNAVNTEESKRHNTYKNIMDRELKSLRKRRYLSLAKVFILLIAIAAFIFGEIKYDKYSKEMVSQMQTKLIGNTFIAHDSHMEGLGFLHHKYWQLTFKDEENLDYAYIETLGPREDDEKPEYKDTYSYTVSRTIFGKYKVRTNGTTYKIEVDANNEPIGISR